MKMLLIAIVALAIISPILGDTKVLHHVNIYVDQSHRQETFSLKNADTPEEELIIEGTDIQSIPDKDPEYVYKIEKTYVADKDGYRVKYTLVREKKLDSGVFFLNPLTLKSAAG